MLRDADEDGIKAIRSWTGLSNDEIREGLFNRDRSVILPRLMRALLRELKPYMETGVDQLPCPLITAQQLSRRSGIPPERVVTVLYRYPTKFSMGDSSVETNIKKPEFPDRRLTLNDCRDYGLSPKRIAKNARFQSRSPGGGPVQKAGIQDKKVDALIRKEAWGRQEIAVNQIEDKNEEDVRSNAIGEKSMSSVAELFYKEANGQQIMSVYKWFEKVGDKNARWISGDNSLFAEKLIKLAGGNTVDFLMWNCIGITWKQQRIGGYPSMIMIDNMDTAITRYFIERIAEMTEQLSSIGNPRVIILVPSNEALADEFEIWKYVQSAEERDKLLDATVSSLKGVVSGTNSLKDTGKIEVMRWDDYLKECGAETQEAYTARGIDALRNPPGLEGRLKKAAVQANGFFGQYGIAVTNCEETRERQLNYLGLYAGEGVASKGNMIGNKDIVWVNLEEGNVKSSQLTGARGDLAIITPATEEEITDYYRWKKETIRNR
jgi:hypothetical protein